MVGLSADLVARVVGGKLYGEGSVTANSVITDSRKAVEGSLFVALKGESFDGADFLHDLEGVVNMAISSRYEELSYPLIVVEDPLIALSTLAKYYMSDVVHPRVILTLTGSVGKTTTKEMTSAVLSKKYNTRKTQGNFNNHIGVPLTLLSLEDYNEALVCEMGMSNKGEISHLAGHMKSDIAMITNIGHSHIENLGSRENIRDAKLEIVEGLKNDGILILNGDEPLLEKVDFKGRIIRVGLSERCDIRAENIVMGQESVEYTLHCDSDTTQITLPCTGVHNVVDSLFAIAAGHALNIDIEDIKEGLLEYKSVGLRQKIYEKNGITVIADCYNAGIESMGAAINMLSELKSRGKRIAVLGDMLELGKVSQSAHESIGERVGERKIDLLFTYGEKTLFTHTKAKALGVESYHFDSKDELSKKLLSLMAKGDTVLFKGSRGMKLEEVIALSGLE